MKNYEVAECNDGELYYTLDRNELKIKLNSIIKKNAGVNQENIKFPVEYRNRINARILFLLGIDYDYSIFESLHANSFFN